MIRTSDPQLADRVRASFSLQHAMTLFRATLPVVEAGRTEIHVPHWDERVGPCRSTGFGLSGLQFPFGVDIGSMSIWGSNMHIQGDVRLENCSFSTMQGAMTVSGGNVLLRSCQLYADFGGDPLLVTGGVCSGIDTTAIGNDGLQVYQVGSHDASPGIRQTGGTLWIAVGPGAHAITATP